MRAKTHLMIIDSEVHNASTELEELLPRISIPLVLLDRVRDCLLG
jgi:hypothetical protein